MGAGAQGCYEVTEAYDRWLACRGAQEFAYVECLNAIHKERILRVAIGRIVLDRGAPAVHLSRKRPAPKLRYAGPADLFLGDPTSSCPL